ncbi:MAG: Hsp70 family protein [Thermoguttaceae bacterium]|nr:Hsp70 family protein [Thermoguttaceae bacterium]MBQ7109799.1 Hsp70 family protein [Thermoguttaceae bacterium]
MYVIAIDYGTGRSGVAYALKKDDIQWRDVNYKNQWPAGQLGHKNCDTALLVNRDGLVLGWGREAFERQSSGKFFGYYANLVKRDLYDPNGFRDEAFALDCSDAELGPRRIYRDGASFYSVDLIASYLAQLKRETAFDIWNANPSSYEAHLELAKNKTLFNETDYRRDVSLAREFIYEQTWILTVPANADDRHKRYMRQAAYNAGLIEDLNSSRLRFEYEPEAAAIYCGALGQDGLPLKENDAFIVVDAGSGTVDVSAYRFKNDGYEQLAKSQAANAGSSYLDEALAGLLEDVFAPNQKALFADFKKEREKDWYEIRYGERSLEGQKEATRSLDRIVRVDVYNMLDWLKEAPRNCVPESPYLQGYLLKLEPNDQKKCFAPVFERAWEPVRLVLNDLSRQNVEPKFFLLVGGMSVSPHFEEFAKEKLREAGLSNSWLPKLDGEKKRVAVLGGAVLQGGRERVVKRILRRSYGTVCCLPYDTEEARERFESRRLPSSAVTTFANAKRNPWVKNAVSFFVKNGDAVETNQKITKVYTVKSPTQRVLRFELVASEETRQLLKTDRSVECWARVELELSGFGMKRGATVEMRFGETEVFLAATEIGRESNRVECRGRLTLDGSGGRTARRASKSGDGESLRFDFE